MLLLLGAVFAGCNDDVTPPIPVIKEFELTVLDKADVPISKAVVNVFMSHKPDVLVMSKNTDIFGKVHFLNLKPGNYIFTAMMGETEILKTDVVVDDDNALNVATMKAGNYEMTVADYTVIVKSDRGAAISGRKVDLLTKEDQVVYKSGLTDEKGEMLFTKIPLDDYLIKVYDEMNEVAVQTEAVSVVEDVTKNTSNVEIVKLIHHSDIVITGFLVDPKGADSPKPGTVSGGGFAHKGGYEYVQLLALKDINFDETPYCVITVGRDTSLHGQVGDVKVQRFSREPVHHLDAEGRERAAVVGFLCEQAHRLFDEGVETLFRREVRRIAGYRRPVECRAVDGVVARHAFHACQLAAHVVLDMLQFLRIVAPRHDVEVCPYRGQSVGMGFVQVLVYPLAVDAVAP